MKKVEKQENQILDTLKISKKISLSEAMLMLNVSESTARRLFIRLENNGSVIRSYGGIQLAPDNTIDYSYDKFEGRSVEQKRKIAECAVKLISESDKIYLDSGTTMASLSVALKKYISENKLKSIEVVTNSLVNLNILQETVKIYLVGGEYRGNRRDFCGYMAEDAVKGLHFSKCFLGTDGFNISTGFTATDFNTARLNEIVLMNSDESIILMDSEKFTRSSMVSYTKKIKVNSVVTDKKPSQGAMEFLLKRGVQLIIPENKNEQNSQFI